MIEVQPTPTRTPRIVCSRRLVGARLHPCRFPARYLIAVAGHHGTLAALCGIHARPYRERPAAYVVTELGRA